jgi:hypothetical protein
MTRPIESIVIVGGGTAGWLTAAYFSRVFQGQLKISVLESERIGRIGVGEATVPTVRDTLAFCGLEDETKWMVECNATFKSAVRFNNWRSTPDGKPHVYYHPFFSHPERLVQPFERPMFPRIGQGFSTVHYWLKNRMRGETRDYGECCNPLQTLCELNKAPRRLPGSSLPDPGFRYAYHFDASLIAERLAALAKARGVQHIPADVVHVARDEQGFISHLKTEQGIDVAGDFFIDCSGFRGLLINQAMGEPFISDSQYLLCDSAVAMPAPYLSEDAPVRPYTSATALENGWAWEIPLSHREGCGYVYCSGTTDKQAAEARLRAHLGEARVKDSPANHIKMRVGHNRRSWVKNCASVGLSSCFVEPLESTTIFLIEYEIANLALHLPDKDFDQSQIDHYNAGIDEMYFDIRDYVALHYHLTNRSDSEFWRNVQQAPIPDSLKARLDLVRAGVMVPDGVSVRLFEGRSHACILSGMGFPFRKVPPIVDRLGDREAAAIFEQIEHDRRELSATMPDHRACVRAIYDRHTATG